MSLVHVSTPRSDLEALVGNRALRRSINSKAEVWVRIK